MVKATGKSKKVKKMISYDAQRDCKELTEYGDDNESRDEKTKKRKAREL